MSLQTAPPLDVEVKWTDELRIYGEGFVGRREELAALDRAWAEGVRIFALHAEGGAGKTRVVVEWLRRLRDDGWSEARRVFVHSFYSQGSDERRNASSELFFEQALAFFGYRGEPITQADEKGRRLAQLLVEQNGLLVLDGLEPLQHPTNHAERGRLKDPGIARLLLSLASVPRHPSRGLCLITSRQPVIELQAREGATVVQQSLNHLHCEDGAGLLRLFQVVGADEELKQASEEFHGHAYSLMLLGSFLRNATAHHDVRRRREAVLLEEDADQGGHARKMFAAYVQHLGENSPEVAALRLLGFFDRAVDQQLLGVLLAEEGVIYEWPKDVMKARELRQLLGIKDDGPADERPQPRRKRDSLPEITQPLLDLSPAQWRRVLNRLRDLRLIAFTGPSASPAVDAHSLLRECIVDELRRQFLSAFQAGHRRLFEHLSGTAPYWPERIEGLQPLYQAITHGCLAGLHEHVLCEIYIARIQRGAGQSGFYSPLNLGAIGADLGAIASFFLKPWTVPVSSLKPRHTTWILHEAAYRLQALGRLNEAIEPALAGLEMLVKNEDWTNAAISANNLANLELMRGKIESAIKVGERSVTFADRTRDAFQQMARRATLADVLHQAGHRNEARRLFEKIESLQVQRQPLYPQLYSFAGFSYCDFLLAGAERRAWQRWLSKGASRAASDACDEVNKRATKTLAWNIKNQGPLRDIALDHLTLSRCSLYKADFARSIPHNAVNHLSAAIDGLRAASDMSYLPRGLLSRAWLRLLVDDTPGCQEDLDEAWEIAERGPMPLFQADIQLYRARLFRDRAALEDARRLIEKHGYHRRDGELADALEAAQGW